MPRSRITSGNRGWIDARYHARGAIRAWNYTYAKVLDGVETRGYHGSTCMQPRFPGRVKSIVQLRGLSGGISSGARNRGSGKIFRQEKQAVMIVESKTLLPNSNVVANQSRLSSRIRKRRDSSACMSNQARNINTTKVHTFLKMERKNLKHEIMEQRVSIEKGKRNSNLRAEYLKENSLRARMP